jgi:hypothetical protein
MALLQSPSTITQPDETLFYKTTQTFWVKMCSKMGSVTLLVRTSSSHAVGPEQMIGLVVISPDDITLPKEIRLLAAITQICTLTKLFCS